MDKRSLAAARAAKKKAPKLFSRFGQVAGVGLTVIDDEYGLKVNFEEEPEGEDLPGEVDGVKVVVHVVGRIRKQRTP